MPRRRLLDVIITHGKDVALLDEDDIKEEAERHHGDDDDGDAPADHVGPVGVLVAARLQRLPAGPTQYQDRLNNATQPRQYTSKFRTGHDSAGR